jgi:ATP-binding cassette subfamily B protein
VRLSVTDGRHALASAVTQRGARPATRAESPVRLKLVPPSPPPPASTPQPHGTDTPADPLRLRSTLQRQGGDFRIEPPGSTHGMRYVLELPLRAVDEPRREPAVELAGEAQGAPPHEGLPPAPVLPGLRVMVVDDRVDAREALAGLLEAEGAEVKPFDSGAAALAWLEAQPTPQWPQVLICDIALGNESGHHVMRRIRQVEQQRGVPLDARLPAVALTGLAEPGDRMQALMAGFQVHLAKPVEPHQLLNTLAQLVPQQPGGPQSAVA